MKSKSIKKEKGRKREREREKEREKRRRKKVEKGGCANIKLVHSKDKHTSKDTYTYRHTHTHTHTCKPIRIHTWQTEEGWNRSCLKYNQRRKERGKNRLNLLRHL